MRCGVEAQSKTRDGRAKHTTFDDTKLYRRAHRKRARRSNSEVEGAKQPKLRHVAWLRPCPTAIAWPRADWHGAEAVRRSINDRRPLKRKDCLLACLPICLPACSTALSPARLPVCIPSASSIEAPHSRNCHFHLRNSMTLEDSAVMPMHFV